METNKCLVTGANGFIGKYTVDRLVEAGYDVVGVDRVVHPDDIPFKYEFHLIDVCNTREIKRLFAENEFKAVIHLAANASLQRSIVDPVYDANNNIIGSLNIAQECSERDIKLVFSSTSAVYAPALPSLIRESDRCEPICPYGLSKFTVEKYIQMIVPHYAILRYGNVYGPKQMPVGSNCLIPRAINYITNGDEFKINGNGKNVRDFIYVDDVAKANIHFSSLAISNDIFNISTGVGTSVNQIWSMLCEISGYPRQSVVEGPPNKGELAKVVLNNKKALECGFEPTVDIVDGLRRTYLWK